MAEMSSDEAIDQPSGNGNGDGTEVDLTVENLISNQMFADMVANVTSSRAELFRRFIDPRRDIDDECGYPKTSKMTSLDYRDLYERHAVASRVVEVWPFESWKVEPTIFEDEDAKVTTPFEKAWDELGMSLLGGEQSWFRDEEGNPIWELLRRADVRSGIGSYGVILIATDDGRELHEPAEFVGKEASSSSFVISAADENTDPEDQGELLDQEPPESNKIKGLGTEGLRKLLYMRVFDESQVDVTEWETDKESPRFGHPKIYTVTIGDPTVSKNDTTTAYIPTQTIRVHWSRIVHVADNVGTNELFGTPRQLPVLNRLLDLAKLYGGSAEMYWRGAFPGLSIETNPQLGGNVRMNRADMRNQMESYQNGLQRYLSLQGLTAKSLAPQVVDPTPQIKTQIESICIQLAIPLRIFMGSERGELSSSQDDSTWNERLASRQRSYLTPKLVVPFVNRLILLKVLPEPKRFSVAWPSFDELSDAEVSEIAAKETETLAKYIAGGVDAVFPTLDFLTRIMRKDEDEMKQVMDNVEKFLREKAEQDAKVEEDRRKHEAEMQEKGLGPQGPIEKPSERQARQKQAEEQSLEQGRKQIEAGVPQPGAPKAGSPPGEQAKPEEEKPKPGKPKKKEEEEEKK